jgi:hypothetical protein
VEQATPTPPVSPPAPGNETMRMLGGRVPDRIFREFQYEKLQAESATPLGRVTTEKAVEAFVQLPRDDELRARWQQALQAVRHERQDREDRVTGVDALVCAAQRTDPRWTSSLLSGWPECCGHELRAWSAAGRSGQACSDAPFCPHRDSGDGPEISGTAAAPSDDGAALPDGSRAFDTKKAFLWSSGQSGALMGAALPKTIALP